MKDIVGNWSQSAPYWEKYRDTIRTMFAPITEALIKDAHISRGDKVLDVGTGPGEPALAVAQFVGPKGKVCGIDPTPEMIAAAQRAAVRQGLDNVEFQVATADHLSFPPGTFDAVVSRFAIMFFPSPLDAMREIFRTVKSGGRLAFAVWSFAERNPFHYVLSRLLDRYGPSLPAAPDSSDAFRFATPGTLLAIFNQAGAVETSEHLLQFKIEAPLPVESFWELRSEMSEKLRSKLSQLSTGQIAEIRGQAIEALRQYAVNQVMSLPAEVLIVSGRKK
jgi:ubiquinone/menaquinone biosynthesis C-methylase UbiE